ncbi:MAG: metallophosphoesterase family protein [Candidatus Promineifilaceae bacterium]
MRIAVFSDVHGNYTALDAVLRDIEQQSPDAVFFAGDLCVFGSQPSLCVQRLREESVGCVHGNTDLWISNKPLLSDDIEEEEEERSETVDTAANWTWSQLDALERDWLRILPFHQRVSPTVDPKDDLFIVHANPQDVERPIYPSLEIQEKIYGEVKQPYDKLKQLVGGIVFGVLCFGHIHIPNVRQWNNKTLANISSVSLPLDGDVRAKYGLLTWQDGWSIEQRRIEYDIDQEVTNLTREKPPQWQKRSQQLRLGKLDW